MRPVSAAAVLGSLALVLDLTGCGGSHRTARPLGGMPSYVPRSIDAGYPGMSYLPARLPKGFRFDGWRTFATAYDIFYDVKGITFGLTFEMRQAPCRGFGHAKHTFHVGGKPVEWSGTPGVQQAWLCLTTTDGHSFGLSARAAVPGDDDLSIPRHRKDAQRLADLVASALPTS